MIKYYHIWPGEKVTRGMEVMSSRDIYQNPKISHCGGASLPVKD
jgi:hypothetical protein